MITSVGEAQIGVNYDFIAKALTEKGQEDGSISVIQHFKINKVQLDEDTGMVYMTCEVFEEILN